MYVNEVTIHSSEVNMQYHILNMPSNSVKFSNLLCIENVSVCNEVFHEASEDVLSIEGEALPKIHKLVLHNNSCQES